MAVRRYNKLIRDRIPEIIAASGQECVTETLSDGEYLTRLNEKLTEELNEYLADGNVEELADLYEVILAVLSAKGVSAEEFERIRLAKREKNGGFKKKLLLLEVLDKNQP